MDGWWNGSSRLSPSAQPGSEVEPRGRRLMIREAQQARRRTPDVGVPGCVERNCPLGKASLFPERC